MLTILDQREHGSHHCIQDSTNLRMIKLTIDLFPGDPLDVDDPLLPIYLNNLAFSSLRSG